ncbi:MAG: tRNA (guanosine(46)-N7)-methyltransferase TrmB [Bacteroidia bacterium]|nr:tRNA (guanosine(46)-N7)-methyltransferase TrmB [Bacteroidia bacterium]
MAHRKLEQFAELDSFPNAHYMPYRQAASDSFVLKGKWNSDFFKNLFPVVLELGCGKGEYTVDLAMQHPEKNFIGVDIKGNRIWRGAKTSLELGLNNAAFLRTRIDFIDKAFAVNEVSEIWITFPDPQKEKARKRLTHPLFLERYRKILRAGAVIHLKTDSALLYHYTLNVIKEQKAELLANTTDLYKLPEQYPEVCRVQTFYEKIYLARGTPITYVKFRL